MFVCVECGYENSHLCEQISPSVLKLSQCVHCDAVVDKYIEYDGVLVLLDMLLLNTNVYRHVVFNRRYGMSILTNNFITVYNLITNVKQRQVFLLLSRCVRYREI